MKLIYSIVFLLTALFLGSCSKSDDAASGTGDAIIIVKKSGTNVVYGYSLYAYTFGEFKSVTATNALQTGKTYTLKMNQGFKTNFYYESPEAEFTTVKPVATTFNFNAVFGNGATDEFQDEVSGVVLPVPVIEKTEYVTSKSEMTITWATVTGADSYAINIYDGANLVFGSPELVNTLKTFSFSATSGGWITGFTPVVGKTYTVRLNAYLYEPNGDSYNLQTVSFADKSMVWGQ